VQTTFGFRINKELLSKIKKQSEEECRSVSEIIRQLIIEYLKKQQNRGLPRLEKKLRRT